MAADGNPMVRQQPDRSQGSLAIDAVGAMLEEWHCPSKIIVGAADFPEIVAGDGECVRCDVTETRVEQQRGGTEIMSIPAASAAAASSSVTTEAWGERAFRELP